MLLLQNIVVDPLLSAIHTRIQFSQVFSLIPYNHWTGILTIVFQILYNFIYTITHIFLALISISLSERFTQLNGVLFQIQGKVNFLYSVPCVQCTVYNTCLINFFKGNAELLLAYNPWKLQRIVSFSQKNWRSRTKIDFFVNDWQFVLDLSSSFVQSQVSLSSL